MFVKILAVLALMAIVGLIGTLVFNTGSSIHWVDRLLDILSEIFGAICLIGIFGIFVMTVITLIGVIVS